MVKKLIPLSEVYRLLEPGPVVLVTTCFKNETNVMAMSWHMMIDFVPPLVGCVMSDQNYSYRLLESSGECVLNIPTVELIHTVVGVGNCSGETCNKFEKFHLTQEPASQVKAPLLKECYVNLECKVIDTSLVKKYGLFILEVVKGWVRTTRKRPLTIHHCGKGNFVVDGKMMKLPSEKL
jgi:flavin reductase (DIM6/NTAB) family NADH-FMN oxidoreductase RutF